LSSSDVQAALISSPIPCKAAYDRSRRFSIALEIGKRDLLSPPVGLSGQNFFNQDLPNSQLSFVQRQLLELKIYTPYFISKATVIEYQTRDRMPNKLSIMDILQKHFLQKKTLSRLFFKVNMKDEIKKKKSVKISVEEASIK
jgi:hypothetical protein